MCHVQGDLEGPEAAIPGARPCSSGAAKHSRLFVTALSNGYRGRFGDIGGGVVLDPAWAWIAETTGLTLIPEPGTLVLLIVGLTTLRGLCGCRIKGARHSDC